jgi:DNA-binding transcriptional ArsR family regulator
MLSDSDALFRILADPTRRQILDLLAEQGPLTVGELAAEFPQLVTSGISKHLMSLREASLVSATRQGRQQVYQLEPAALAAALEPWLSKYERYWSTALERLRDLAQGSGTEVRRRRQK